MARIGNEQERSGPQSIPDDHHEPTGPYIPAMASGSPVLDEALTFFKSQLRVPREVLYHYTSKEALLNILRTTRMWATDFRFMNDPEELDYGLQVIAKVLDEVASRQREVQRALFLTLMKKQLRKVVGDSTYYSISFCQDIDLPSQWRQYGLEGSGFVLGWSVDSEYPEIPLKIQVEYNREHQTDLAKRLIRIHLDGLREARDFSRAPGLEIMLRVAGSLGIFFNILASNFKHPKWSAENELRYIYQTLSDKPPAGTIRRIRSDGQISKPYIETDFSTAALRGILVGPNTDSLGGYRWLRNALNEAGYRDTPIYKSAVPPAACINRAGQDCPAPA